MKLLQIFLAKLCGLPILFIYLKMLMLPFYSQQQTILEYTRGFGVVFLSTGDQEAALRLSTLGTCVMN